MEFSIFGEAVAKQFKVMSEHSLYRVQVEKDKLWETYLGSFPEGTNPIFKERTEHDCQGCKSFVRAIGAVVAIINGELVSVWDIQIGGFYQIVADAMAGLVKSSPVDNVFLYTEKTAGIPKNHQQLESGEILTWSHFFVNLPTTSVVRGVDIGPKLADARSTHDVSLRGLLEIEPDAVETVLELIAQNSLYRGDEHKFAVESFQKMQKAFCKVPVGQDLFVWERVGGQAHSAMRIRNTVIGTLLTDLSEGKELEYAVKAFETKVAPTNYKRPTSLVTKAMIQKAQATIEELGFTSALERRYAVLDDITINNILFADRTTKKAMNVFDELASQVPEKIKKLDKVEEVTIENFIANILPKAESLEVLFENRHGSNLVSLIAPVDPTAKGMFKWQNNFSWSYAGSVADSMRERVAELGGRVDGALRFTHAWNHPEVGRNSSLMDLHVFMPGSSAHKDGSHNTYPSGRRVGWNHRGDVLSAGTQDVDHTAEAKEGFIPVENISFPSIHKMPEGKYIFKIHNWQLRHPTTSGFKAEIEFGGQVFQYEHPQPLKHHEWVTLAEVTLKNGVFSIEHKLTSQQSSVKKWNLNTQTFHKVNVVMHSPNHWDGHGVGNKHYFFMLADCANEGQARGFFNEFLTSDLDQHRKVFEMVGSKMKTEESNRQLSGLGFSSTQRSHVLCRVKGSFNRVIKINF